MKRTLFTCSALLLAAFASCEPYLSLDEALNGKRCDPGNICPFAGYRCVNNVCVPDDGTEERQVPALQPGGPPSDAGAAGVGNIPASGGSAGASGEQVGEAGAGSVVSAGAGGMPGGAGSVALPDAGGLEPGPVDAGCASPVPLYRDRDRDGFGTTGPGDEIEGCPPQDGFATVAGDCLDDPLVSNRAAVVNPGQTLAFEVGYPSAANPSEVSFDYDCDGVESPGSQFSAFLSQPNCNQAVGNCGGLGLGYLPTERSGAGENPLCGSIAGVICTGVAGSEVCTASTVSRANQPLLCN